MYQHSVKCRVKHELHLQEEQKRDPFFLHCSRYRTTLNSVATALSTSCSFSSISKSLSYLESKCMQELNSSGLGFFSSDLWIFLASSRVLPNQFSDHETVVAQFDIPLQMSRGKVKWKINVTCICVVRG